MWAPSLLLVLLAAAASAQETALPAFTRVNADECASEAQTAPTLDFTSLAAASFGETTECGADANSCTYKVTVASDFDVEYYPGYKVVRNYFTDTTHVLHQCGTPQPSAILFEGATDVRYFEIPLTAIAVDDSTAAYFLEALQVSDRVRYAPSYSASPCMDLISGGCARVAGDTIAEDSFDAYISPPPYQGGPEFFDDKKVVFSAVNDPGALNRAEWIAYLAPFFNREGLASEVYAQVKAGYEAASTPVTAESPTVVWLEYSTFISGTDGAGQEVSGAGLVVHFAAYKVQLTTDAGGRIADRAAWTAAATAAFTGTGVDQVVFPFSLYTSETSSGERNVLRRVRGLLEQVDVVIDETYIAPPGPADLTADLKSNLQITDAEAAAFPFLVNNAHWKHDKLQYSGDAWFGEAVARPDIVLADLKTMFAPAGTTPVGETTYFRNVSNGDDVLVAPEECTAVTCDSYAAQEPLLVSVAAAQEPPLVQTAEPTGDSASVDGEAALPTEVVNGAAGAALGGSLVMGVAAVAAALL